MVRTYGLTHIALSVRDAEASFAFYQRILGVVAVYRSSGFIQAQTPETRDVLVFEEATSHVGKRGGISHFGFRLVDPGDIAAAIASIEEAGGRVLRHGEFVPGEPYVFFADPDGYEVELWYELPTPVDSPALARISQVGLSS